MAASPLPPDVLDALRRGNAIEAIKLLRASTGLGLKEAKDLIDAHVRGDPIRITSVAAPSALPAAVLEALQRGNKIEAIGLLREQTGLGLKEAKDAVEAAHGATDPIADAGSPGAVPKPGNTAWLVLIVVIAALVGYYFLRNPG